VDIAVSLVKAYLELCGYFVLTELPVRAVRDHEYFDVTDLDVIAVRFPHRPLSAAKEISRPLDVFLGADAELETLEDGIDVIIGEVKEGEARFNPALRRIDTIAFALRRLGCCPEEMVDAVAESIARQGSRELAMPGSQRCQIRLVAFAGHGGPPEGRLLAVSLAHCSAFIADRLRTSREVLAGTQFKDPVLGLFALQDKLSAQKSTPRAE
jgi:hypothetical protein